MQSFVRSKKLIIAAAVLLPALGFAQPDPTKENEKSPLIAETGKIEKLEKEDDSVLQRHNPFYAAYGDPLSKIQFSFKSPFVRKVPVYFAYTQVIFWALTEDSKPFRDATYNPEIFYRWEKKEWSPIESIDFAVYSHVSNGKNEQDSRSYEKNYVRVNLAKEGSRWVTRLSAEMAYMHTFDRTNKDIHDYIGPLSLYISFVQLYDSWIDKSEVTFKAAPGGKLANRWDQGGYQLSWSFRVGKHNIVPAFYLQYYHGYAESLLNYNENVDEFRGGVIF